MPYKARTRAHRQELLNIATARGDRLAVAVLRPNQPYTPEWDEWVFRAQVERERRMQAILDGTAITESELRTIDGNR